MSNVYGFTGVMGSGKSTIALVLKDIFLNYFIDLHIIEIDIIRRYILWESTEKNHILIQRQIAKTFNFKDTNHLEILDRNNLSSCIFKNKNNMAQFSLLITPYIKDEIKKIISNHDNNLIVWSYLVEEKYDEFLNNPLFFSHCSEQNCYQRLIEQSVRQKDNLPLEEVFQRIKNSSTYEEKIKICKNKNIKYFEINNNLFDLEAIIFLVEQVLKIKK